MRHARSQNKVWPHLEIYCSTLFRLAKIAAIIGFAGAAGFCPTGGGSFVFVFLSIEPPLIAANSPPLAPEDGVEDEDFFFVGKGGGRVALIDTFGGGLPPLGGGGLPPPPPTPPPPPPPPPNMAPGSTPDTIIF